MSPYWFVLLMGFVSSNGVVITDGVRTGQEVPSTVSAPSWAPYMVAYWTLDEGGASTRANTAGAGTCGGTQSNCDLTRNGTPTNDTTYFKQGTGSNTFDGSTDWLFCSNATCTALDIKSTGGLHTGSVSFGCWATENTLAASGEIGAIIGKHDGTYGYELLLDYGLALATFSTAKCQIDSYTTWIPSYSTLLTAQRAPFINHYICTYDDASSTQTIYANGNLQKDLGNSGFVGTTYMLTSNSTNFKIGSSGNAGDFYGYVDECFVYRGVLSNRDACRICSCGVDGSLCTCSGDNNWVNKGRWDTDCGDCPLPTSCLTPPGVD